MGPTRVPAPFAVWQRRRREDTEPGAFQRTTQDLMYGAVIVACVVVLIALAAVLIR